MGSPIFPRIPRPTRMASLARQHVFQEHRCRIRLRRAGPHSKLPRAGRRHRRLASGQSKSVSRNEALMRSAISTSNSSPAEWPKLSLTTLKPALLRRQRERQICNPDAAGSQHGVLQAIKKQIAVWCRSVRPSWIARWARASPRACVL